MLAVVVVPHNSEKRCMSYEQTAVYLEYITGVQTNAMSQQRLVHRQQFQLPTLTALIEELSVDGGKVRLRTALLSRMHL